MGGVGGWVGGWKGISTLTSSTEAFSVREPAPHVSLTILSTRAPKER